MIGIILPKTSIQKIELSTHSRSTQEAIIEKAYPHDTSLILQRMIDSYARTKRAKNVSFRKMVNWMKVGERATHYIHSYPAKLLPQIAHFFLSSNLLSKPDDIVLDPFGGTGTVALEAILAGRNAYYADVNPLARLIARVKTKPLSINLIKQALSRVEESVLQTKIYSIETLPNYSVNLLYWYDKKTIIDLSRLKAAIQKEPDGDVKDFLLASFSTTCRKASKADPHLSVPVRLKASRESLTKEQGVSKIFDDQVSNNLRRMQSFLDIYSRKNQVYFVGNDARSLKWFEINDSKKNRDVKADSVSLIITSPPYAGAQKYIRASSLSIGWLDLAEDGKLKPLENASIGREHFPKASYLECPKTNVASANGLIERVFKKNPLRSMIVASYVNEMEEAISEMIRVLKPGGHLVLVIGNNIVCGLPFKSSEYLAEICENYGLTQRLKLIDEIKSRGLMTKRNKTASVITREWVLMFQK